MLDNFYLSYDIIEEQKDPEDPLKLGKILRLCEQKYTDLEEIVERFAGEISHVVNTVVSFSKYVDKNDVFLNHDCLTSRKKSIKSLNKCINKTPIIFLILSPSVVIDLALSRLPTTREIELITNMPK